MNVTEEPETDPFVDQSAYIEVLENTNRAYFETLVAVNDALKGYHDIVEEFKDADDHITMGQVLALNSVVEHLSLVLRAGLAQK